MPFDWTAAAIVSATLIGPALAVEVQKRLEGKREARRRREELFRVLMATRSIRVAVQHVEALNAIDLTFDSDKEENVRAAWRAYLDVLNATAERRAEPVWHLEFDGKFIDLLYEMSQALGRKYDKTYLKNSWYRPQAHHDREQMVNEIQLLMLKTLKGEQCLPVAVHEQTPNSQTQQATNQPQ